MLRRTLKLLIHPLVVWTMHSNRCAAKDSDGDLSAVCLFDNSANLLLKIVECSEFTQAWSHTLRGGSYSACPL